MKKYVALFLIVTCLLMAIPSFASTTTGDALWALSTSQHVVGIIDPTKVEERLPAQNPEKPYIRGFLENGLVREKGLMEYCISTSGTYGGLTYIETTVVIFPQFEEMVNEVATDILEREPEDAFDYIMATMYFSGKYVGHVFFKTNISKFHVGNIVVNRGADTFPLYMGDFDLDGKYELGFAAGWTQCAPNPPCVVVTPPVVVVTPPACKPKPKPRPCKPQPPTIIVRPEIVRPTIVVTPSQPTTTTTTCHPCTPLLQINLFSNVTTYVGGGCKK